MNLFDSLKMVGFDHVEFRSSLARLDGGGGREGPTDGQDGKEEVFSHPANIPWNVGWSRRLNGKGEVAGFF